ncbi:MAG TPA: M28 family peptidase, partial [Armatimonadota bacterium]|nr:M28 family peptidase [Armatimonadota bacterium]
MEKDPIPQLLAQVSADNLRRNLFSLCKDPLPYRKLSYTIPGHDKCTLYEADDFIEAQLRSWGYTVEKQGVEVQSFRCDESKPKAHRYSAPQPEDPWYTAYNLSARITGSTKPEETIVLVAHKDSQSWVDSPGAADNGVGTVSVLEIARILSRYPARRSLWFLFCNEEHWPWTSANAAVSARERGENVVAVINLDSVSGKAKAVSDAGRKTNVARYTAPEGKRLADLMALVNEQYRIGLEEYSYWKEIPNDDDGSFIKAGFPCAIACLGSFP